MSTRHRRYRVNSWCIDVVEKPWFIDVLTYVLVGVWMALMFATIQMYGPDPWVLGSGVVVLLAGMGWVFGQRLSYLRIGDRLVLGSRHPGDDSEVPEEWRRDGK